MASIKPDTTIKEVQEFVGTVYNHPNDRFFDTSDMLCNIQRFAMRGLKGIRKRDTEKVVKNMFISIGWFMSLMNRLHIDIENELWNRFPYLCSYCGTCPCTCKAKHLDERLNVPIDHSKRPHTLKAFQKMHNDIYPDSNRTLDDAGVHFAEEVGEFAEALLAFRSERKSEDFEQVLLEAADYLSCYLDVFNSLNIDLAEELAKFYSNNCHECNDSPCSCSYTKIKTYKS